MKKVAIWFRDLLIDVFGQKIHSYETGEYYGKAVMIPWGGKIHIFGSVGCIKPAFLPIQGRICYWKQVIAFAKHEKPDYERVPDSCRHPLPPES
jgi:hypothetical protein